MACLRGFEPPTFGSGVMIESILLGRYSGMRPFAEFFQTLQDIKARPLITLEAHAQDDLWQSLDNIKKMGILEG